MKKSFFLVPILLCSFLTNAQTPRLEWVKTIQQAKNSSERLVIFKCEIDNDDNIYSYGRFKGDVDFGIGMGGNNRILSSTVNGFSLYRRGSIMGVPFLSKSDKNGNLLWVKQINFSLGDKTDEESVFCIDSVGNSYIIIELRTTTGIVILENTTVTGMQKFTANAGISIIKFNSNSEMVWHKEFSSNATDIKVNKKGEIIFSGTFKGDISFGTGLNVVTLTSSSLNMFENDTYIVKVNANGDFLWAKKMEGSLGDNSSFKRSFDLDNFGNVYASVYRYNKFSYTYKFSSNGNQIWKIESPYRSLCVDNNQNVIITGNSGCNNGKYTTTINGKSICKYNKFGKFLWGFTHPIDGDYHGGDISVDKLGNIYSSGDFSYTQNFNTTSVPGSVLISNGKLDGFLLKLDLNGNFKWVNRIGGLGSNGIISTTIDKNNDIIFSGYYGYFGNYTTKEAEINEVEINIGENNYSIFGNGVFLGKISQTTATGINPLSQEEKANFSISPNPNKGSFTVQTAVFPLEYTITNIFGIVIKTGFLNAKETEINLGSNAGLYFFKAGKQSLKMMVE